MTTLNKRTSYSTMTSIEEHGNTLGNDNKLYGKIGKLIKIVVRFFIISG